MKEPNEPISRRVANPSAPVNIRPPQFRSWEEQSQQKGESKEEAGKSTPPVAKHRKKYSYWQTRDFKCIVALVITAIIAAAVYYGMKG